MDGGGEGGLAAWLIDVVAAGLLGAACAFAGARLGWPAASLIAGSGAMLLALLGLRLVEPEPRHFRLPPLVVDFTPEPVLDVLELTEPEPEPLVLDDVLAAVGPSSRVVRLFAQPPLPTAGELVQRIRVHLGETEDTLEPRGEVVHLQVDASAALREALADLKRSLA